MQGDFTPEEEAQLLAKLQNQTQFTDQMWGV
jgi:hypothetical protein